jgi:hypothetical protein
LVPAAGEATEPLLEALQWSHLGCRAVNRCAHVKSRNEISHRISGSATLSNAAALGGASVSAKVQGWVWDIDDILPQRRLILLWLANRATDNGVCFPGQAEVRRRTSLGEKMVRRHLHWLAAPEDENGQAKQALVTIIERRIGSDRNTSNVYVLHVPWARRVDVERDLEELKHLPRGATTSLPALGVVDDPQGTDQDARVFKDGGRGRPPCLPPATPKGVVHGREEPGHRNRHPDRLVCPPAPSLSEERHEQQQGVSSHEEAISTGPPRAFEQSETGALALVDAFYRGLGAGPALTTRSIQRRDLAIARQLVVVGATAEEAEAYARDMISKGGRMAPVDLRSFERERLGWRAQRRGQKTNLNGLRVVTGTGLSD